MVVGEDCYDDRAVVVDPTLWSYDDRVEAVWTGRARERPHRPHGHGSIFEWGRPCSTGGEPIELAVEVSRHARMFLDMLGPLDRAGWGQLARAPVQGWPAAEIVAAMDDTPGLTALVPIDRLGMLTDRNPCGYYLRERAS